MFCFERMMIYLNITQHRDNKDTYVAKCLHKVINIAEKTWEKGGGFSRPLVTLDLGKYGSIGMRQRTVPKLNQLAESTLSSLLHNKWTFSEWEESFVQVASINNNNGYIAALQRTLASRADCLVLVGGGYFHELALNDYKRNHPDKSTWCIHLVCAINSRRLQQDVDGKVVSVYNAKD